jgi:hypothetical protein
MVFDNHQGLFIYPRYLRKRVVQRPRLYHAFCVPACGQGRGHGNGRAGRQIEVVVAPHGVGAVDGQLHEARQRLGGHVDAQGLAFDAGR